jgi:replicative DNA helicase
MHPDLPSNIQAERATLGSLLLNRDAITAVAPFLLPGHFYMERHAQLYTCVLACYSRRVPPDIRTVSEELRKREWLEDTGGSPYLADLIDSVPTSYHVEYYARIVEACATRRRLIDAGGKIASMAFDERHDLETTIGDCQHALLDAAQRTTDSALTPIEAVATELYTAFTSDTPPGVPSGFLDLDSLTGGLHPQDLLIVAARPGVGKSALALQIALAVAEQQRPVLFFSLEMGRIQLLERLAAMRCRLDLMAVRQRCLNETQLGCLFEQLGKLASLPIYINDAAAQSPLSMRNLALRFRAEHGPIGLVVVDYLQLMQSGDKNENRVQEVSAISRGLKLLAKELDAPVLALSQLSRAVEGRASHIPMLSDLRESGAIEQDADLVVFIYREEMHLPDTDKKGLAELYIAKHRNGPLGVVPLYWDAPTTRFSTVTYRTQEGGE